ncbi:class I SAM-dependent methyltransferase [Aestuariivirga sp.]|uniref:class I SAM-dependent methyltransferase n=1 Tax=Aestuariivirga sp. TaxID=2650926 RepID=UPI0025C135F0|nr:class I SAM-dependent methyltransferase [Aestuariivirga sp.]MCA3555461.1 class I SAM-dependent methyltransferase [Aestuariivirga sp.]
MDTALAGVREDYEFTNSWFDVARGVWSALIPQIKPRRILEIGSYEGASACFLIDLLGQTQPLDLHCIDTWDGGIEHKNWQIDMPAVENRFRRNIQKAVGRAAHPVAVRTLKGSSHLELAKLIAEANSYDFIYIDGSHQAADVLTDAVMAFRLLQTGGVMAFDDYLWAEALPTGVDPLRCPKPAIDAFTNIFCRKLRILSAPLYQLYVQKIAD